MKEFDELTMKEQFKYQFSRSCELFGNVTKMVVAIKLNTGATEIIVNTENIQEKYEYYLDAYDEDLCLKHNKDIQIIGCLFV